MLRRIVMLLVLGALVGSAAEAQKVEITPYVGFVFGGSFETAEDSGFETVNIKEGETFGFFLDFTITPRWQIELFYAQQDTRTELPNGIDSDLLNTKVEYFQVGAIYQWHPSTVQPFITWSIGGTQFAIVDDVDTRFSATFGGGFKTFVTDHIGFRVESRIYSTFIDKEDEIACWPRGCFRYEDGAVFLQLDIKAGLVFAF